MWFVDKLNIINFEQSYWVFDSWAVYTSATFLTFIVFSMLDVGSVEKLQFQPFPMQNNSHPCYQHQTHERKPNEGRPLYCNRDIADAQVSVNDSPESMKTKWNHLICVDLLLKQFQLHLRRVMT